MSLGQGIGELWEAVRDRVEVSGEEPTWEVTAGSFDSALTYARERFEQPVVLARRDRARWWPRITLTITTDPALAAGAPPLEDLAQPFIPEQAVPQVAEDETAPDRANLLPSSLEAIFAHQEELRVARQRVPHHDTPA
ncbi:MAG TPA: hypothetical protein VLB29_11355 [Nocardioidaceae bacterium]|nr:hypothetical protein [Nocardioidaceae bacterium]